MNSLARHLTHRRRPLIKLALLGTALTLAAPAAGAVTPTRPGASTRAASAVTYQSASLNGAVNPAGQPTTYFFQYGPTARYGSQSLPATLAAGARTVSVSSPIGGLVPVTRYHFRLVAVSTAGSAIGADSTFTTAAVPLSLAIAALPNPVVFGAPLSVVGTLSGTGAAGRAVVLQSTPSPFTTPFQNVGNPELTSASGGFQFNLLALPLTAEFRVVSVGPGQSVMSATAIENVALAVTMRVRSRRTRRGYYSVRFSGLVHPAEDGARVSVQRLVASHWKQVAATNARAATSGSSSYARTLHLRRGGFYRVFVTPVEPAHVANSSQPTLVHAGSRL